MKHPVLWQESEDFAPDLSAGAAETAEESEEDDSFWDNMIFPI